jgi:hypothetical protein
MMTPERRAELEAAYDRFWERQPGPSGDRDGLFLYYDEGMDSMSPDDAVAFMRELRSGCGRVLHQALAEADREVEPVENDEDG